MESILSHVNLLLQGKPYEEMYEFCDFSLNDQNNAATAKGVTPTAPKEFKPVIKKTVTYVVAAVLINDRDEVLMMQEAKSSCAGQWYLPAGRMEPGEDIEEAATREVLEETGLNIEIETVLLVESAGESWYRFVVTGNVTGGILKTPAQADSESLQAKWIGDLNQLSLRSKDVFALVEKGQQYMRSKRGGSEPWHLPQLTAIRPHKRLLVRLVVSIRKKANNRLFVLVSEKTAAHLPVCELNPLRSVHFTIKKYMTEIFGINTPPHRPHGLLSVEHSGKPVNSNDGICLSVLVSVRVPLESIPAIDKYTWLDINDRDLTEELLNRMGRNMTVLLAR
ncbi:8-oxo-dGDP phosphatase NUDT18 [Lepeophtheirus salmonis]|nr:8-oxo-dGDP phosphatase NUDT18-like [Lepeophtheirus salmonis]